MVIYNLVVEENTTISEIMSYTTAERVVEAFRANIFEYCDNHYKNIPQPSEEVIVEAISNGYIKFEDDDIMFSIMSSSNEI